MNALLISGEHVHGPSHHPKSFSFLSVNEIEPANVMNIPYIEEGQKWPEVLHMPYSFQATYMKYHYNPERMQHVEPYKGKKSHKTRLIDAENNRYASFSWDHDTFYQRVVDYKNNLMVTKRGEENC